jgi:hypothetical protein
VEEVSGANAQERSRKKLLISLKQILREALELNLQDALEAGGPGAEEHVIILWSAEICFVISKATAASGWERNSFMVVESSTESPEFNIAA